MDFKVKNNKKYLVKKIIVIVIAIFIIIITALEIYSPIYLNNFQDLDAKAEVDRVGGDFFNKDGDEMYYADYKKTDADPILLIHGFGASSYSWRKNISALNTNYRVITVDLLGFGMSKNIKSNDIGLDRDVEILNAFIKDKNLRNLTVVGHSMGGIVAQKLAIQNPSDIISLILINSTDSSSPMRNTNIFSSIAGFPLIKNPLAMFTLMNLHSVVNMAYYDKSLLDKLTYEGYDKGYRYKNSVDLAIKFAQSAIAKKEDLHNIKQLTLVYSSDNDQIINPSDSSKLSDEILNSKLIKVPNSGHLLMEEQSGLVNDGILQWITESKAKLNQG